MGAERAHIFLTGLRCQPESVVSPFSNDHGPSARRNEHKGPRGGGIRMSPYPAEEMTNKYHNITSLGRLFAVPEAPEIMCLAVPIQNGQTARFV